ncbi:hypothetical protein AB0J74_01655 [Asanoa sp. NPDC049573]|uniref:hypothetical protein n=1 Tax=Asanoa sp. NPDC049573 TaxID=3155396 RepID=UPI003423CD7A
MGDLALLAVDAVWLVLLGLGALVIRRELQLLQDRLADIGTAPMDGIAVGSFAPRTPGLGRDDVVLFLFGDCEPCHDAAEMVSRSLVPGRFLCVVNDGTVPGSAASVLALLPSGVRTVTGDLAKTARERFQVHSAPFGVTVVDGLVAAKGTLRNPDDLDRLAHLANGHHPLAVVGTQEHRA